MGFTAALVPTLYDEQAIMFCAPHIDDHVLAHILVDHGPLPLAHVSRVCKWWARIYAERGRRAVCISSSRGDTAPLSDMMQRLLRHRTVLAPYSVIATNQIPPYSCHVLSVDAAVAAVPCDVTPHTIEFPSFGQPTCDQWAAVLARSSTRMLDIHSVQGSLRFSSATTLKHIRRVRVACRPTPDTQAALFGALTGASEWVLSTPPALLQQVLPASAQYLSLGPMIWSESAECHRALVECAPHVRHLHLWTVAHTCSEHGVAEPPQWLLPSLIAAMFENMPHLIDVHVDHIDCVDGAQHRFVVEHWLREYDACMAKRTYDAARRSRRAHKRRRSTDTTLGSNAEKRSCIDETVHVKPASAGTASEGAVGRGRSKTVPLRVRRVALPDVWQRILCEHRYTLHGTGRRMVTRYSRPMQWSQ